MSLYGALFSGVSGLSAQSSAMGAISDNISNVNTVGYKGSQVNFQTLVTKQVSITEYSPGGVQSKPRASIDVQGLLQATSSSTDVAISGNGFFVVNTMANPTSSSGMFGYTRAGSFKLDKNGFLQNVSGFYMQGWPLKATDNTISAKPTETQIDGNTYMKAYTATDGSTHYVNQNIINSDELQPLNLKTIGGTADPTTQVKILGNLPSGDAVYDPTNAGQVGGFHQTSVLIYDSLGNTHGFDVDWMKTASNTWNVQSQSNVYSVATRLADSTPQVTGATFSMDGFSSGGTSQILPNATYTGTTSAYFNNGGVIALGTNYAAGAVKMLPKGQQFTLGGAGVNNGNYIVKNTDDGTTTAINNAGPQAASVTRNGVTTTWSNVSFGTGSPGSIDFTAATGSIVPSWNDGDLVYLNSNGNTGYYEVSNAASTPVFTLTPVQTVTVDTAPYQVQRGLTPPVGATSMDILDSNDQVYASQGRLDFQQATRADVLGLEGKSFSVTVNGKTLTVEFDADGANGLAANTSNVVIDISSPSISDGSKVAQLVANALKNPNNWAADTTDVPPATPTVPGNQYLSQDIIALGNTLPVFAANGSTLKIIQQVGGQAMDFDVTGLPGVAQAQTHRWKTTVPSSETIDGKFTLSAITQTSDAIQFDGHGTPASINVSKFSATWCNGAESMTTVPNGTGADHRVKLFLGNTSQNDGLTQAGGTFNTAPTQNGSKFGNFSGVSVGTDGVVTALFDNGVRKPVFQVPVATFANANGLESLTGNTWIETDISGTYTLRSAGEAGAGSVNAASLEASTVDIGTEFTTMITTQRAYSAAAKIITTADQMLDELIQIKR